MLPASGAAATSLELLPHALTAQAKASMHEQSRDNRRIVYDSHSSLTLLSSMRGSLQHRMQRLLRRTRFTALCSQSLTCCPTICLVLRFRMSGCLLLHDRCRVVGSRTSANPAARWPKHDLSEVSAERGLHRRRRNGNVCLETPRRAGRHEQWLSEPL